jgi:Major Facilitator Superfamily
MSRASSFHGWRVVVGAFVLAVFGWGVGFYGPPVYLHAVREARGWSIALISAAITVHFVVGALVIANLPALYRRFGLPAVTKAGVVALALGVAGWALADLPWLLFGAALLSGAGWVTMGAAAINAIIAPWFVRLRPRALAMAYNGASIGGVVFSPLWVAAIGLVGFPGAALAIGAVMIIGVWLLADHLFARTPADMGLAPDGDASAVATSKPVVEAPPVRSLWRDRRFVTLAAAMALGLFAQIGLIAHLVSLLVPALGAQAAGLAAGAATAAAIGGRTLVGWLMPPSADRRLVAAASHLVQIAGSVLFILADGHNVPLLLAGVILFGAGIGNATSLPPLIAQSEFAAQDVQRVVPLIVAISQGAYAFAPAIFGVVRALQPASPTALFVIAGLLQAAAIACFLVGRQPTSVESSQRRARPRWPGVT